MMQVEEEDLLLRWRTEQDPELALLLCSTIAERAEASPLEVDVALLVTIGREVERCHPTDAEVLCSVGRLYLAAGGLMYAMKPLVAAASALRTPLPYRLLGELTLRMGDAARSVKTFERALALGGDSEDLRAWLDSARGYVPVQHELGREIVARSVENGMRGASSPGVFDPGIVDHDTERTVQRTRGPDGRILDPHERGAGASISISRDSYVDFDLDAEGLDRIELFEDSIDDDGGRTQVRSSGAARPGGPAATLEAAVAAAARQASPRARPQLFTDPLDERSTVDRPAAAAPLVAERPAERSTVEKPPAAAPVAAAVAELPLPAPRAEASVVAPAVVAKATANGSAPPVAAKPPASSKGRFSMTVTVLGGLLFGGVLAGGLFLAKSRGLLPMRSAAPVVESAETTPEPIEEPEAASPEPSTAPEPPASADAPAAASGAEEPEAAPSAEPAPSASAAPTASPEASASSAAASSAAAPPVPVPPRPPPPTGPKKPPAKPPAKPPSRPPQAPSPPSVPLWDGDPEAKGRGL